MAGADRLVPAIHGPEHHPLGPDPIPGGYAVYEIKVFEDDEIVVVGDGRFLWPIPYDLDESALVALEAGVSTPGSTAIQIQVRYLQQGAPPGSDVLSQKIVIDAGERNSKDAATRSAIAGETVDLFEGDWLAIDVDAGGSSAMGLVLMATVIPLAFAQAIVQGAKGDPGGVTAWTGQWATSTGYTVGQAVSNNGSSYVSIVNHSSTAATEPGVGVDWEDAWMILSEAKQASSIEVVINGNGHVVDPGTKAYIEVPFDCVLDEVVMLADFAGNAVVDIWKETYANYPPTDADSITASSPPTISAANKSVDSVLSGWTTGFSAGDILGFNVDSCSTITILTVSLKVLR